MRYACLLAAILLLVASGGGPMVAAAQPATTHLTAAYSERIAVDLPLWFALEQGLFQKHGLDVDLQLITSSNAMAALLAGQVDVDNGGGAEALSATTGGSELVVLGSMAAVTPFVFEVPQSITSIDELRGQKVGVSAPGSSSDVATRAGLRAVGLQPDQDVNIVAVGSLQNRTAALLSGAIQGGVAQPPDSLTLEAQGFHPLFDLAALKLPTSQGSIIVQRSWLAQHRDVAQNYVDAIVEAIAAEKADRAAAIAVLQKYLQTDDQQALGATYDYFVGEVIPSDPSPRPEEFTNDVEQLSVQNPAIRDVDLGKLIDASFVQSALERGLGQP
jgi:NitT/TauT family transport system substrate-binding protein